MSLTGSVAYLRICGLVLPLLTGPVISTDPVQESSGRILEGEVTVDQRTVSTFCASDDYLTTSFLVRLAGVR